MFEFIETEIEEDVEKALLECKIGYTWFEESSEALQSKLQSMGLENYKVNSLSKRKFLIRKDSKESWKEFEETDLSVWFCKLRRFEEHDFVISRVTWIECSGLPMPAWKEENLKAFTAPFGFWVSWTYQSDNLLDFFNPLICVDTMSTDQIREELMVLYKGKQIKIKFKELEEQQRLKGKIWPMELSSEAPASKDSEKASNISNSNVSHGEREYYVEQVEESSAKDNDSQGEKEYHVEQVEESYGEKDDKSSMENRTGKAIVLCCTSKSIKKINRRGKSNSQGHTQDKWRPQHGSSSSNVETESKKGNDTSNRSEVNMPENKTSSQSTLCIDVDRKLKVKSGRGRPKKPRLNVKNPFDIGGKFKRRFAKNKEKRGSSKLKDKQKKGINLQIVPTGIEGKSVKAALEILSTAELMGLVANDKREEVLKRIVQKLDKGEL
ncbi:hypothetical protein ACET3Z_019413 [Daucus carota]